MFFQIEDICAQDTDEAIRRIIRSLPRDLPATYERALERVVRNRKAEVARKIFRWVAAAKRPLSLMEIREAIAVEPCQPFSQPDKLVNDVDQLVPWCGNLLVLDEEEGLIQFAHPSVKDYLLSGEVPEISSHHFHIKLQDVDREAGEICCTYLNFSDFERQVVHSPQVRSGLDPKAIVNTSLSASSSPTMTSSLLRLNNLRKARRATEASDIWRQLHLTSLRVATMWPQNLQSRYYFLAYASEYWLHHTTEFSPGDQCWGLFKRLVLAEKATLAAKPWSMEDWEAFSAKVQNYMLKTEHRALRTLAILEQPRHVRADLSWMVRNQYALLCSDEMLLSLVKATDLVENFWSTWDPVLIIAAERRRPDFVKQVLKLAGGFESDPAQNKATDSNTAPTQMDDSLIQSWTSAWQQAKFTGTHEMLDLLLTYSAIMLGKVRERGYEELRAAALTNNLELTRRLLNARVDPNVVPLTQPWSSGSILAAAAFWGSYKMVKLLLHAGANVNAQVVELGETALLAAAVQGKTLIVIALLAVGASVNVNCDSSWDWDAYRDLVGGPSLTPLAAAAGFEDVMLLLLLAGAHLEDIASIYSEPQSRLSLGRDDNINRAKWSAYLQCYFVEDPTTDSYRPRSGLGSIDREFFHALENHVKSSCGTEMGPMEVQETVELFLNRRLENEPTEEPQPRKTIGESWLDLW